MNHKSANNGSWQSTISIVTRLQVLKLTELVLIPRIGKDIFLMHEACQYNTQPIQPTVKWVLGIKLRD